MKKYIKAYDEFYDPFEDYYDCFEEASRAVIDFIESGDAYSYDDVVSETYAQIQSYFDSMGMNLEDKTEDEIYEAIMRDLDDLGYIDNRKGFLLYEYEERN